MAEGCICDFVSEEHLRNDDAAILRHRQGFSTAIYSTSAGSETSGPAVRWGQAVDIGEAGDGRTHVRFEGREGWIDTAHVAPIRYLQRTGTGEETRWVAPLFAQEEGGGVITELLWGDRMYLLREGANRSQVRVRGRLGWVDNRALGTEALLEVYFVDVGQGDGVLIRTPDGRHLMIDGGFPRERQPTGKNAADFVDWKFFKDYGLPRVSLDVMIASHCDADHYGGLWDLVSAKPAARRELDTAGTDIGRFYHAGVSWWVPTADEVEQNDLKGDDRKRWLGPAEHDLLVRLIGDEADVKKYLPKDAVPALQGQWRNFLAEVVECTQNIDRLSVEPGGEEVYLPGFEPGTSTPIRVLAPILEHRDGAAGVFDFKDSSQNTNGHSVLLNLQYDKVRILLTGDLNKNVMQRLLAAYEGDEDVFACDVAKGCHHGSDDVSFRFLQNVEASATIISSGDAEGHAHPRPAIVAASAITGKQVIDPETDELLTPLIYSTEIERTVRLGRLSHIGAQKYPHQGESLEVTLYARSRADLDDALHGDAELKKDVVSTAFYHEAKPDAFKPAAGKRNLFGCYVVTGVVYGLVNVRTDGTNILCATLNEAKDRWNENVFKTRFEDGG